MPVKTILTTIGILLFILVIAFNWVRAVGWVSDIWSSGQTSRDPIRALKGIEGKRYEFLVKAIIITVLTLITLFIISAITD